MQASYLAPQARELGAERRPVRRVFGMRVAHEIADQRGIALGEHQRATETVCVCREARIRSGAKKSTESPRWGRGGLECPAVSIHNTLDEGTRERECKLAGRSNTATPRHRDTATP